jgi:hypothetical protein
MNLLFLSADTHGFPVSPLEGEVLFVLINLWLPQLEENIT